MRRLRTLTGTFRCVPAATRAAARESGKRDVLAVALLPGPVVPRAPGKFQVLKFAGPPNLGPNSRAGALLAYGAGRRSIMTLASFSLSAINS